MMKYPYKVLFSSYFEDIVCYYYYYYYYYSCLQTHNTGLSTHAFAAREYYKIIRKFSHHCHTWFSDRLVWYNKTGSCIL